MRRVLLGAAALSAMLAGPFAARAGAGSSWHVVTVKTAGSTGVTTLWDPHCSGGDCTQPYWVAAQQTGGLDGTLVNNGTLLLDGSPGFEVSIIGVFTGTVQGCGTGSFALSFPLTKGSATTPFSGAEVIVPGSGTGELTGITGAGTYTFDPLGGSNGTSTGSMTVLCKAS